MKISQLDSFSRDIRDLYVKTGSSKIEDVFIRVSKVSSTIFNRWIKSDKRIEFELKDGMVRDTLLLLVDIQENYSPDISSADFIQIFSSSKNSRYLPYVLAFSDLLSSVSILEPFSNILNASSPLKGRFLDNDKVLIDLNYIDEEYEKYVNKSVGEPYEDYGVPKTTQPSLKKHQVLTEDFVRLLNNFSEKIALAADNSGFSDLANDLRNKGILLNQNQLIKHLKVSLPGIYMWKQAEQIAKQAATYFNVMGLDSVFEFIKEKAMGFTGMISDKELQKMRDVKEEEKDFSYLMRKNVGSSSIDLFQEADLRDPFPHIQLPTPPSMTTTTTTTTLQPEKKADPIPIKDKEWMNTSLIMMLSCIMISLYNYISKYTGQHKRR